MDDNIFSNIFNSFTSFVSESWDSIFSDDKLTSTEGTLANADGIDNQTLSNSDNVSTVDEVKNTTTDSSGFTGGNNDFNKYQDWLSSGENSSDGGLLASPSQNTDLTSLAGNNVLSKAADTPADKAASSKSSGTEDESSVKDLLMKNGSLALLTGGIATVVGGYMNGKAAQYNTDRNAAIQQQQVDLNKQAQDFKIANGGNVPKLTMRRKTNASTGLLGSTV